MMRKADGKEPNNADNGFTYTLALVTLVVLEPISARGSVANLLFNFVLEIVSCHELVQVLNVRIPETPWKRVHA